MPPIRSLPPVLAGLIREQDGLVTVEQLVSHDLDASWLYRRVKRGEWQKVLPEVVATTSGTLTRRQLVIAAYLWAGSDSAIDGADACRWYGLSVPSGRSNKVHVVVNADAPQRSIETVAVRRATADIVVGDRGVVPYVDRATAVIVAARGATNDRDAVSIVSKGLQTGLVRLDELRDARDRLGDKWCRDVDKALVAVGIGLRSPAERDSRGLIVSSRVLPEPLWNQWLDLGDGGCPVCVDALWPDACMIHEVNGRRYHALAQQFEDMHARHRRLTVAGLVAIGSTATEIRRRGPETLTHLEQIYLANRGRGIPAGVTLIDPPSNRG